MEAHNITYPDEDQYEVLYELDEEEIRVLETLNEVRDNMEDFKPRRLSVDLVKAEDNNGTTTQVLVEMKQEKWNYGDKHEEKQTPDCQE